MIAAARLSDLVGLIYDCAIDPERWPIAMEAIRIELGFHNATLDLIDLPSAAALTSITCNIPSHYLAMMADAGPDIIEQWGGEALVQSLPLDRPAVLSHVNPAFDLATATNPYYLTFAKPQGIIDVLSIGLARDARAIGTVSFGRHVSAGPIGEREVAIARLLVPHLQRAATINRILEGAVLAQATFAATLDTLTVPVFLVDAALGVVHANPAARTVADRGDMVRIARGRLQTGATGASNALEAAVVQAARNESELERRGLGIPVSRLDGGRGALHVLPLCCGNRHNDRGAVAAVFVASIDTPFVAPTEMAAALFGLTPAETRLFEHLVTGHTQATAAVALGVERSTVKSHLLQIYDKVGVRRQSDLVRVAASLKLPILSSEA